MTKAEPRPTRRWPAAGGYAFAADPELTATEAGIFWIPASDPGMLLLAPAPTMPGSASAPLGLQPGLARESPEGLYLRQADGRVPSRALVLGGAPERPLAAMVPLDELLPDRLEALLRFHRAARGRTGPDRRLTPLRRRNLRQMLRAVDGRRAGATHQAIAEAVFGAERVAAIAWKSMPLRDTVMRRAREGLKLVHGGYRDLLRHHRTP